MNGLQYPSISTCFTLLGSGSTSRLFLVIRSSVFSAEWLFYQPLWVFFSFLPPSSVWEGPGCPPLNPHPPPPFPMLHFSPFPLLGSSLLKGLPSGVCVQMTWVIINTTANEFTPLQVSRDGYLVPVLTVTRGPLHFSHLHWSMPKGQR